MSPLNQTTQSTVQKVFSTLRRIYMVTEKDFVKEMKLKELKTLLLE